MTYHAQDGYFFETKSNEPYVDNMFPKGEAIEAFRHVSVESNDKNKTFKGWSLSPNSNVILTNEPINSNCDVYAVYEGKVTLDGNGGTSLSFNIRPFIRAIQLISEFDANNDYGFTLEGKKFAGWSKDPEGKNIVNSGYLPIDGEILYAAWIDDNSYISDFVTRLYQLCLNRNPDSNGKTYWVNSLQSKQNTASTAVKGFFESNEMKKLNLSNEEFVKRCYRVMMNREADKSGLAYWVDRLAVGMSRLSVVKGFVGSNEFTRISNSYGLEKGDITLSENRDLNYGVTAFVSRCYTKALGRGYDVSGLNYWTGRIMDSANKKEAAVSAASNGFFNSNEFLNKGLSDRDFIKVCYRTFLDREADSNGLNYWLGRMSEGKEVVLKGFANSNEFSAIMARFGIR